MNKLILIPLLLLGACATDQTPGIKTIYQTVDREVQTPCPAKRIPHPAGIKKPLPSDPGALLSIATAKLKELLGKGGYADQVDSLQDTCKITIKP